MDMRPWLRSLVPLLIAAAGCGDSVIDVNGGNPVPGVDLGLLAHWALDESQAGSPVIDSGGFGLTGAPSPNPPVPTTDVPPVHFPDPYSLLFDGTDQYVALGNPPILNLGGPVSVAAWIRATGTDGYQDLVAHGYTADNTQDEALRIKFGAYEFTYWNNQEHDAVATIPASDVGAWVHLCGVFDGSSYLVYRNGVLAAATADSTVPPANVMATWGIGAHVPTSDSATRFFSGEIDDVRVYGRALSATEVDALFKM